MVEAGVITASDAVVAKKQGVPFARQPMPLNAPHLAQRLVLQNKAPRITTTFDAGIQLAAQRMAAQERAYFDDAADVALVVVENKTRNVVAYVGGTDYWGRAGQVDLANRTRSPGSALKPFIYGLAFDNLVLHPASRMQDAPTNFGDYAPKDFDGTFSGTGDGARRAADVAEHSRRDDPGSGGAAGLHPVAAECRCASGLSHTRDAPSLPVALGGLGISLSDIAMLYAGIAEGGTAQGLRVVKRRAGRAAPSPVRSGCRPVSARRAERRGVARWLGDGAGGCCGTAASDSRPARLTAIAMPGRWAFPTITPWLVWVGRRRHAASRPCRPRSGAPILLKMFGLLPPDRRPAPPVPAGALLVRGDR